MVTKHKRKVEVHRGDCNDVSAGKGDRLRKVDRSKFNRNYDGIDWSKGRKQDKDKLYKVRSIKESDRPEERRASTP